MKLKEIMDARSALVKLKTACTAPRLSYTIMKLLKATEDDEQFYVDKYRKILDKYGEKNEDGTFVIVDGLLQIKQESYDKFNAKVKELNEIEVEDKNVGWKIKLSDLDGFELTPEDMLNLDMFINAEE